MRVFVDTSVLVAALLAQHPHYERSFAVLDSIQKGNHEGFISAHTLPEVYSTLTKMPSPFRQSPERALLGIEQNILAHFESVSFSSRDYAALIRESAISGIQGGTIYDALILKAAAKVQPQRIYTLNFRHFQAVAPADLVSRIVLP